MMGLVMLHKCGYNTGTYPRGDPMWINPAFVVATWPEEHMLHGIKRTYSKLRLHGDETHQDWTLIASAQRNVSPQAHAEQTPSQGE